MNSLSFWEHRTFFKGIDVAIIGSGIVGLNTAIHLKKDCPALRIIILERGYLPFGASTRNAGFACFGSIGELADDLSSQPESEVFGLVERRWKGLLELRSIIGDKALDYQPFGGFEIFKPEEEAQFNECQEKLAYFNRMMESITGETGTFSVQDRQIPSFGFQNIDHLIFNKSEGQLDTGLMMKALLGIAKQLGIEIFNGITVEQVEEVGHHTVIVLAGGAAIEAKNTLLATNGFTKKFFPHLDVVPARNQVLVTKPLPLLPFKGSFHYERGYFYFRNVDGPEGSRILLGGGRHLAKAEEATQEFGHTTVIQSALTKLLHEFILPGKKVEIDYWWSGIMGIGQTKKPIVEMLTPNIGIAARLGGMGVALGNLVGKEAATMIKNNF
ncbi:MAG: FAD-dependent oxidoreductase [Saprospiraceae bacterium]